jgi:hypothetical protein
MNTYRDMTFCDYYKNCLTGLECHRALTKKTKLKALITGFPICQFVEKPQCFAVKRV